MKNGRPHGFLFRPDFYTPSSLQMSLVALQCDSQQKKSPAKAETPTGLR
jgi:hypothetical protein